MFIVLGFVVVGIATALRIREYEAKKLLLPLIVVALLVNFSGLFCGLIIDGSNILTNFFLQKIDAGQNMTIVNVIHDTWKSVPWDKAAIDAAKSGDWTSYFAAALSLAAMQYVTAVVYIYVIAILIERQAMFAVLYILSPLAFLAWTFPFTKKYWNMWWEHFLKWASIGAAMGLFIWCGSNLLTSIKDNNGNFNSFGLLIALVFLFVAAKIGKSSGSMIAGAAIGLAKTGAGVAMGAAGAAGMGTLKGLGKASGATELGRNAGHAITRAGEKLGAVKAGTTSGWENTQTQKDKKQYESMSDRDLAKHVNARANTTAGRKAQDIQAQILAERGGLDRVDASKRDVVATRAINGDRTGAAVSAFKKADPRYAALDQKAVKDKIATGLTETQAKDSLVGSAYRNADVESRSKFSLDTINDPRYLMNTTAKQMGKAGERMSEDRIRAHKELITNGTMAATRAHPAYNTGTPAEIAAKQAELDEKKVAIDTMH